MIETVSFVGAGKVAGALAFALQQRGIAIVQVCSPSASSQVLAQKLGAEAVSEPKNLAPVDLVIVAVQDAAIPDVVASIPNKQAWAHTSGSVGLEELSGNQKGVFYPLQTFSAGRPVNFERIYFCLEANSSELLEDLDQLASQLTSKRMVIDAEKRKALHLAAVFACNFSNQLYQIAETLLEKENLPFELLSPLITETALKAGVLSPSKSQTGPAQREDYKIIENHINSLKDQPELQEIYKLFTQRIIRQKNEEL